MVRALESLGPDSSHLEFFGLTRPPFVRLSQTSEIFQTEQNSLLMAHLASATEQPDCLVVICGANGSGKTTLLNHYIAGLDDNISYASIDETCNGEKKFYCAFLRQLGFSNISGSARELRRIAKEFLVHRGMAGDPVLIIIDNAHLLKPAALEQLRRISTIKVQDRRVLSVVLAGNSELARIMDSPALSQTKFHTHVRFDIRAFSVDEVVKYISYRLKSAGSTGAVRFSSEVLPLIYRYTGGNPGLINMLCHAVLAEAYSLKSHDITARLVRAAADTRRLLPHLIPAQDNGRRNSDPDVKLFLADRQTEERMAVNELSAQEPDEIPTLTTEVSAVSAKDPLTQVTQLTTKLGELTSNRVRALQDMGRCDLAINKLREKFDAQSAKFKELAGTLGDKTDEVKQLNQSLSDRQSALQNSEKNSLKLTADLQKARSAKCIAEIDCDNANAKVESFAELTSELQATVSELTVDLQLADQRVAEIDVLEQNTAALKDGIDEKTGELHTLRGELDARDAALAGLDKQFTESQSECAALGLRIATLENLEASVAEKETCITDLQAELDARDEALAGLDKQFTDSQKECAALGLRITALENLEASVVEKETCITDLQAELDARDEALADLDTQFVDSQKECTVLGLRAATLETLEASVAEKEVHISDLQSELDSRDKALADLEKRFEDSENECATLRLRTTALNVLEEAVFAKEAHIAVLNAEIASRNEETMTLGTKNGELESRNREPKEDDRISVLESELQAVSQMLRETQAQLKENPSLNASPKTQACDPPKPKKQQAKQSSTSKPTSNAAITAFEIILGGKIKKVIEVTENQPRIMIGRSEDSDLCLNSGFVSRHHSLISYAKQGFYIEDLNSFNGTIVNSTKISRCNLRAGDVVVIGDFEIRPRSGTE